MDNKRDVKTVQLEPYLHETLKKLAALDHRNIKNYLTVLILDDAAKHNIIVDSTKAQK